MPKQKRPAEAYDSDDGFVEDAPKSKKSKKNSAKTSVSLDMKTDDDGNAFWDISGKRRLQISEFKGNTMINIREFYEKDGKMLPGKKGISLNLDQFNAFVELLPQLEGVLAEKGISIPRPTYDQQASSEANAKHDQAQAHDSASEDEAPAREDNASKSKLDKFRLKDKKKNFEGTSDEDEG